MIISIFNQKGGVAKTTTVTNLGAALIKLGKKTLLVDIDPQANTTNALGINDSTLKLSIYDLLNSKIPKKERILEVIHRNIFVGLDVLPSDITLSDAEISLSGLMSRETILSKILNQIKDDYDYILIDCPPSLGLLSVNALVSSDYLIIPVSPAYFSVKGIKHLFNTINLVKDNLKPELDIMGVLVTMYDSRKSISKDIKDSLEETFGDKVFNSVIRTNTQIEKAQENQIPVIFFDEHCNGYTDYMSLAKEVLGHEGK